jgi:bacteriocin biosynthesis cyclodehydratase domain-containing protein
MPLHARDLHVISVDDDRLLLKRGIREVLVSGPEAAAVVRPLVALLDGTRDLDQAVAALPEAHRSAGRQLADALAARQLLADDIDGGPAGADALQSAFYRNFGPAGHGVPDVLRTAHVVVHGSGLVARSLISGLVELGIGAVTGVADPGLADPLLDDGGPAAREDGPVQWRSEPVDDLAEASLVAAAADLGQEDALLAVARRALAADVVFLPAWLSEMVGFVGPLTHPFETACLRCYQLRADANAGDASVRRAMRRDGASEEALAASTGFLPPMAAVVGQVAAMEVAKALGGFAPTDVVARSVEINLLSFRSSVRRVLRLPRCPDCGEGSRRSARVVLTGPQIRE